MKDSGKAGGSVVISLLTWTGFFGILTTTISKNPVLPLYVKSMGSSDAVLGLIAAISPLAGILFSFPVGLLSDKLGKKKLLIAAAVIFTSAPLLYLLVSSAYWLIPIRFFHGMATAILGPIASAIIISAYEKTKGEKLGIYSSATLIGRTIAPVLGGAIITLFAFLPGGWNYRLVYAAAFVLSAPVLFLTAALKEPKKKNGVNKITLRDFSESLKYIFSEKKILGTGLVEMATYFSFGVFETYIPVYLARIGVPAYATGILFAVQILSIALTKPLFGKLSDRIDRRLQITVGILALGAAIAAVPLLNGVVAIGILSVVFGLAMSLSTVATSTYVADVTKKEKLGTSLGALSSIMDIGHSGGPLIAGIVISSLSSGLAYSAWPYAAGFLTCLAVCVISAAVFVFYTFRKRKPA